MPADGRRGGCDPTESLSLVAEEITAPVLLATLAPARRTKAPDDYLGGVLGSYRVLELLGKGGMGYVFRAEHVRLGREVALKLLRSDYASRRDAVARFFQEARTVNRVRHRNIVDVTDFVELDDGTTFIIMEMLSGTSLGAWAKAGVELPRALAVLAQICDGLAAAHQVGVIHRDLKPDNVIVLPSDDGTELVKLLDFGVAKLMNPGDEDVGLETAAGSVIGTPAYMSPEQAGGMRVDARSDIYSLGAIMYEMFCGQPMFRGRSFGEYVRKHLTASPVPPRLTAGGARLAPALEAVILRCVDKDPDHRFADIGELRDALLGMLALPEAASRGPRAATSLVFRAPALWTAPSQGWPRVLGGALVLALGGVAAFWLTGPRQPSQPPSSARGQIAARPAIPQPSEPLAAHPAISQPSDLLAARSASSTPQASDPLAARSASSTPQASDPLAARAVSSIPQPVDPLAARSASSTPQASDPLAARSASSIPQASAPIAAPRASSTAHAIEPITARPRRAASPAPAQVLAPADVVPAAGVAGGRWRTDTKSKSDTRGKRPAKRVSKQPRKPARPAAAQVASSPAAPSEPAPATTDRGSDRQAREPGDAPAPVPAKPAARTAIAPTDTLDPFRSK